MSLSLVALAWLICAYKATEDSCTDGTCAAPDALPANWEKIELNETATESINWHDYLSFHWNTPLLHASEDPILRPLLEASIYPSIENGSFLKNVFEKYHLTSHFGNVYNMTEILTNEMLKNEIDPSMYDSLSKFVELYNQRIIQWMTLYVRNQAFISHDSSNIFLLKLKEGDTMPIDGIFSFPMRQGNDDLISIMGLNHIGCNDKHDGIYIFDPRGGVSGYGYGTNGLITTAQHQHLAMKQGSIAVFPSKLSFIMLPFEKCTRYFIVSFASIETKMRNFNIGKKTEETTSSKDSNNDNSNNNNNNDEKKIVNTLDIESIYKSKNDQPYWEQNIGLFYCYGTPIFSSSINDNNNKSITTTVVRNEDLNILKQCILFLSENIDTIHKSNRGKTAWQSKPYFFDAKFDSKIFDETKENNFTFTKNECIKVTKQIENYIYEQILLWILSFRNSYYFDDNGIFIQIDNDDNNIIAIKIENSWANVNYGIGYNIPHLHSGYDLSGVFYVNTPESCVHDNNNNCDGNEGSIIFKDPRTSIFDKYMRFSFGQFHESLKLQPKNGDTFLFPSWLHHWVVPTYNDKEPRISIAFNVNFLTHKGKFQQDVSFVKPHHS